MGTLNSTKEKARVTILMPVYNGEKYLKEAIDSILNQTFTDFEFLIINDGSIDKSREIISSYKDPRIRLVNNERNIGLTKSLNKGLDLAKGEYIGRMDADDISLSKRLEIQVAFMDRNPNIGASGTWAKITEDNKKIKHSRQNSDPNKIKTILLFKCPILHPSVIICKKSLDKNNLRYKAELKQAQDYDLWSRAIKFFPIANISKVLIQYRIHDSNISKTHSNIQNKTATQIKINQLKAYLNIDSTGEEIIIHESIYKPKNYKIDDFLDKVEEWFLKLIKQNQKTKFYNEPEFSQVLAQRWLQICSANANYNFQIFKRFWKSSLRKKLDLKEWQNWKTLFRFFIKCLLKKPQI